MTEFYLKKDGSLIPEHEYAEYIDAMREVTLRGHETVLSDSITAAIKRRIRGINPKKADRIGVLFSGGVDSTLIALLLKQMKINPICISVGVQDGNTRPSPDILYAREIAAELKLEHHEILLDLDETEATLKKIIPIVGTDIVRTGVGAVTYTALKKAKALKIRHLFSGLGSEEIFAGYERHIKAERVNEECWKGLLAMHQRDLARDIPLARYLHLELHTPLLDTDVILIAMGIPGSRKLSATNNKLPIRRVALRAGLRRRFSYRKKNAAQYGSNMDRAIQKLAKRNGFRYKKDYLQSLWK